MKLIRIALSFFLVLGLIACSKEKEKEKNAAADANVAADSGELVEVTFPAVLFQNQDIDEVIKKAKSDGFKEVIKNDDGSLTYKMSKKVYNDKLIELEKAIDDILDQSKKNVKSIKDITHDENLSKFTFVVDQKTYNNSFDGLVSFTIGFTALNYQLFKGTDADDAKVSISLKDEKTGEVFSVIEFPEVLKELNKNNQ